VQDCYKAHGINIPWNSGNIYSEGTQSDGSRGDIVCWNGHVGICDGYGNVIHSYRKDHKVYKDNIDEVTSWDKRNVKGYVTY
jgi:cell wall-associated NlpC family hydrolase